MLLDKIVRVNLTDLTITKEEVPSAYQLLGGRALTGRIVSDEVKATCEPLGRFNKVVIALGILGGTTAPQSGRISVGAKSPLTGGIKEANAGGTAGQAMGREGIKALIIEGQATEGWYLLKINNGNYELLRSDELAGKDTYNTVAELQQKYGSKSAVITIGPAGENLYANSSIAVTDMQGHASRHAGRGGLGAVLGSKRLKAIVIEHNETKKFNPSVTFNQCVKDLVTALIEHPLVGAYTTYGTPGTIGPVNELGFLPTRNFSDGRFEGAERYTGEALKELIESRGGKTGQACQPGCVIRCSSTFVNKEGKYITSGLEYETLGLLGSNLLIDDPDEIAIMDRQCDSYGLDTMETGSTIGVAMEAGLAEFGDAKGAQALIDQIGKGTRLGRFLGSGTQSVGTVLGVKRIPAAKGQGFAAYDPRGLKGTGVTYATSPMGADHTAGNVLGNPTIFPSSKVGAVAASKGAQNLFPVLDSLGFCLFTLFALGDNPELFDTIATMVNEVCGSNWTGEDVLKLGSSTLAMEKQFNLNAGLTAAEDKLPEIFYTEVLPSTQTVFDITEEEMQEVFN